MTVLHICCNLAGSTVFPQLFEALAAQGLEQVVFVPEKRAADLGKNEPRGVKTIRAMTVRQSDALFFFRKAQRSVPAIEEQIDMAGVTLIHAHTLFTDGSIAARLAKKHGIPYAVTLRYSDIEAIWKYEPHLRPMARRILGGAARVVCLGGVAKEKVLGWFKGAARDALADKLRVIPNGLDPAWLDGVPRTAAHTPVRVGFAGRMNERKRPLDARSRVCRGGLRRRAAEGSILRGDAPAGSLSGAHIGHGRDEGVLCGLRRAARAIRGGDVRHGLSGGHEPGRARAVYEGAGV